MTAGRPTLLTQELTDKIIECYNITLTQAQIAETVGIPLRYLERYLSEDKNGLATKIRAKKHKILLAEAERALYESLTSDDKRVKLEAARFSLEKLNRIDYGKEALVIEHKYADLNDAQLRQRIESMLTTIDDVSVLPKIGDDNVHTDLVDSPNSDDATDE